jgi:hypothetical protein
MDIGSLRQLIRDTLTPLNLYSADAEELLCATCAQESHLGEYRHQVHGPAVGIFQMEPEDFDDIWTNFLAYHFDLATALRGLSGQLSPNASDMQNNDPFAIAMCRAHYERMPGALPSASDLDGLWAYYKAHYNTPAGAATQDEFVANYQRYVGGPAR